MVTQKKNENKMNLNDGHDHHHSMIFFVVNQKKKKKLQTQTHIEYIEMNILLLEYININICEWFHKKSIF